VSARLRAAAARSPAAAGYAARVTARTLAPLAALLASACTGVYLETPAPPPVVTTPTTVNLSGGFCTDDTKALLAPVKILFAFDYSQSMVVSDPNTQRAQAAVDLMKRLGQSPGLFYGILLFRGDVNILTKETLPDGTLKDGFQSSMTLDFDQVAAELRAGLPAPENIDQETTDFIGALSRIRTLIEGDILDGQGDPDQLARTKYVVIFLSDGFPSRNYPAGCQPGGTGGNACPQCLPEIEDAVIKIERLKNEGVGDVKFDTALIFNNPAAPPPPTAVHRTAATLMACMATAGDGDFRDFSLGEPIDFLGFDYQSLQRLYLLKMLLVTNLNARPGTFAPDSDGDGLSDAQELALGSNPLNPDTDGDGFGDLLESRYPANFHINVPDPGCPVLSRGDRDGDGLSDCEEIFIGTAQGRYDSDRDGAPDGVEWIMGTRPSVDDMDDDPDRDGLVNRDELRAHTDPNVPDIANLSDVAQRLTLQSRGPQADGRSCYDFRVENIHLAQTLDRGDGAGWNEILVSAAQVPFDAPGAQPVTKIARVRARLNGSVRSPASGELTIAETDFVSPTSTFSTGLLSPPGSFTP
jgi:Bacterial TSP3 repeat